MAKINRFNGNLQAPASAAIGTERTLFGEVTQSDDLTDQFTADLLRGWGIVGPSDEPTLQDFNAMGFTLGQLHAYLHQVGVAEYNAAQEYHEGSFTNSGGVLYVSLVDNNVGNTPASSPVQWESYGQGADPLNSPIAWLTGSSTINLTTGAPDTSQIVIVGSGLSVNGFTVAANRFFVVKMTGSNNTLVNSASLDTGRGADIRVAPGDSFLMRSTGVNTVQVVCGYFLIDRALGSGQTWQNFTGSRAVNTTYTNTTGRTIEVAITCSTNAGVQGFFQVNGVDVVRLLIASGASQSSIVTLGIPANATYRLNATSQSYWWELR